MVAHARWMYEAAGARNETRGMHKRADAPATDPGLQHRLLVGGLDDVWVKPDPTLPVHSTDPLPDGFTRQPAAARTPALVA
jgi:hypothetical protein